LFLSQGLSSGIVHPSRRDRLRPEPEPALGGHYQAAPPPLDRPDDLLCAFAGRHRVGFIEVRDAGGEFTFASPTRRGERTACRIVNNAASTMVLNLVTTRRTQEARRPRLARCAA